MAKDQDNKVTVETGLLKRSVGGLGFQVSYDAERKALNLTEMVAGGAAAADGILAVGDTIIEIDGHAVEGDQERLSELLLASKVGDVVKVKVLRKSQVTFEQNGAPQSPACPKKVKNIKLKNIIKGNYATDTLHQKAYVSSTKLIVFYLDVTVFAFLL